MADVIMPQMGESIAEGTVTKWLKNLGDRVERDEPLFEISTDKVDAEIPSPAAGILKEIRVAPGTTVPINTVVAVIAAAEPAGAGPRVTQPPAQTAAAPAAVASAPAAVPVPPVEYRLEDELSSSQAPRAEAAADDLRLSRSSPVVRRIAAEHHLDIREIPGTGIGGRVTKQDILGHLGARAADAAPAPPPQTPSLPFAAPAAPPSSSPAPAPLAPAATSRPGAAGRVELVPISPIRRKTAEHMVLSKRTSAHVTTVFEIDMTRVAQLRDRHRADYEQRGVRLSWMPFILKAVVDALKAHPVLNASLDSDSVVYHKDVNLGIAVALDWGLIVPVIHHAEEKNVLGLARAVGDLAARARAKKLKVEEVQGGTFTITNPGVFGSLFGTPIINQPQVAILDVGVIEKRPVVRDDAIAIRTMAFFALTFDHRLVDGADADRFMSQVKQTLQEFDESSL